MRSIYCALIFTLLVLPETITTGNAGTQQESYTYDDAGRLVAAERDDGSTIGYVYDNAGNLLEENTAAVEILFANGFE